MYSENYEDPDFSEWIEDRQIVLFGYAIWIAIVLYSFDDLIKHFLLSLIAFAVAYPVVPIYNSNTNHLPNRAILNKHILYLDIAKTITVATWFLTSLFGIIFIINDCRDSCSEFDTYVTPFNGFLLFTIILTYRAAKVSLVRVDHFEIRLRDEIYTI